MQQLIDIRRGLADRNSIALSALMNGAAKAVRTIRTPTGARAAVDLAAQPRFSRAGRPAATMAPGGTQRRQWTTEEDNRVKELVALHGKRWESERSVHRHALGGVGASVSARTPPPPPAR